MTTGKTCGCAKGPAKHREAWWWNGDANNSAGEEYNF